ncbi:MAG: AsmA family protein, partial [Acidobacteriota bacterium]
MTRKTRRRLLLAAGLFAGLVLLAILVLPFVVDVNQFRPTIERAAQDALGRPVKLGEMRLSLFPSPGIQVRDLVIGALPEEGGGDLLTAARLQVGARLRPLLHRELEVTSLILQEPSLVLSRRADGEWNVMHLLGGGTESTAAPQPDAGNFSVARLRLQEGRIVFRDAALVPGRTLEAVIEHLNLDLTDLALDSSLKFKLSASLAGKNPADIQCQGEVGPLRPGPDQSMKLSGRIKIRDLDPLALADWITGLAGPSLAPPAGLLGP